MSFISHTRGSRAIRRVALFVLLGVMAGNSNGCNAFQLSSVRNHRSGFLNMKQSNLNAFNSGNSSSPSSNRNASFFFSPTRQTTTVGLGSVLASTLMVNDPIVEAHVLTDIAHLGLDLAVFMGQGVLALRVAAVIGRVCSMAADYIPDHTMVPEEFVFQVFMLLFSCWGLLRAAILPSAAAIASNIKIRDGRAYRALFAPTGLTWNQYKAMAAVGAIDWVALKQGESVHLDDAKDDANLVFWLYDGQMELQSRRPASATTHELPPKLVICRSKRETANAPAAMLAEHRLLATQPKHAKTPTAAHVTSETAIVLRLNVSRLRRFITDNDPTVAEAMRVLLVQGLDAKLDAHWSRMAQL